MSAVQGTMHADPGHPPGSRTEVPWSWERLPGRPRLTACHVRAGDVLGRFGGEEFVALLPGAGQEQACWIAERLRERVRVIAIPSLGAEATVTVSIGVAALGRDGNELFELLAAADAALYRAKQSGRDRVCTLPLGACPSDPRHRCP
jgi:predicted signal transduction protein with EAL and GGDEF domain